MGADGWDISSVPYPSLSVVLAMSASGRRSLHARQRTAIYRGEVHAFSGMIDDVELLGRFYTPCAHADPGMAGAESRDGLSADHPNREELRRCTRFVISPIQTAAQSESLGYQYWSPGQENQADGLARPECETEALLSLTGGEAFSPGPIRPLRGVATGEPSRGSKKRGGQ